MGMDFKEGEILALGANSASLLYHKGGEEDLKISMNKTFKYCATYLIDVK